MAAESAEWTAFASEHGIDFDSDSDESEDFSSESAPVNTVADVVEAREDTLKLVAEFYSFAAAEQYVHTSTVYRFKVAHNSQYKRTAFKRRVFACASHEECSYRLYVTDKAGKVRVEAVGAHGTMVTTKAMGGMHKRLSSSIDSALGAGDGPKTLRKKLQHQYGDDEFIVSILPTWQQLKSRKQHLKSSKTAKGTTPWEIKNVAQMHEWAADHFCKNADHFFGSPKPDAISDDFEKFEAKLPRFKDELLVLECFAHDVTLDDGTTVPSFGVVFTSRRVLRNAVTASIGQGEDLLAMSDGTYKIFFEGWTLSSIGTCGAHRDRSLYSRSYEPWAFIFVRTESTEAYTTLFRAVKDAVHKFFDIELKVRFGSGDHASTILNAYRIIWPEIVFLSCWPHFARNAETKSRELQCVSVYEDVAKTNIEALHLARSAKQFEALSSLFVSSWSHAPYAKWVSDQYLSRPWSNWYAVCSQCPGVLPNQNPIESYHRSVKETSVPSLRAMTAFVLNNTLPLILVQIQPLRVLRHYCEGPVPAEMVETAKYLKAKQNYRRMKDDANQLTGIVFNARDYMVGVAGLQGLKVDSARARRYAMSIEGQLLGEVRPEEVQIKFLSLHLVTIGSTPESLSHSMSSPSWSLEEIEEVRCKYRCDCKMQYTTGWICSHIVAAMALVDDVDLTVLLDAPLAKRLPGRPLLSSGALTRDDDWYGADRLRKLFIQKPGYPVGWKILKEFPVRRDPTAVQSIAGVIKPHTNQAGVYFWKVVFENAKSEFLAVQDLVDVVIYTRQCGYAMH